MSEQAGILHVEDSEDDRFLLERAWNALNFHLALSPVASGEDALDYLGGRSGYADRYTYPLPCIVLLDLKLNGVSGFDVLKWIRQRVELKHLVVIVCSGSDAPEDVARAMQLGANAFVRKPHRLCDWADLLRSVKDFWLRFHEFPWPSQCRNPAFR